MVGDLEKTVRQNTLEIWRNMVGNLEKTVRRNTLEIWRNMVEWLWRFHIGVRYGVAQSSAIVSGD